jgi:formate hydrogenlyase maturation protein HycH
MSDARYAAHQQHAGTRRFAGGNVVFYSLSSKFVQEKKDRERTPPKAQEVIYYSLAIGHHLGVIDCLKPQLQCPQQAFEQWIAQLPADSEARRKLAGVLRFGEINIDNSHCHMLALALDKARASMNEQQQAWSDQLIELLQRMVNEPAIYLMVRRHDA